MSTVQMRERTAASAPFAITVWSVNVLNEQNEQIEVYGKDAAVTIYRTGDTVPVIINKQHAHFILMTNNHILLCTDGTAQR